jgi:hypothetical protein
LKSWQASAICLEDLFVLFEVGRAPDDQRHIDGIGQNLFDRGGCIVGLAFSPLGSMLFKLQNDHFRAEFVDALLGPGSRVGQPHL